jgi:hypothetical protein
MRDLAFRRHQDERARHRALRTLQRLLRLDEPWRDSPRLLHRYAIDRTPCSCFLCGNPRRHLGEPTIQERRHLGLHELSLGDQAVSSAPRN